MQNETVLAHHAILTPSCCVDASQHIHYALKERHPDSKEATTYQELVPRMASTNEKGTIINICPFCGQSLPKLRMDIYDTGPVNRNIVGNRNLKLDLMTLGNNLVSHKFAPGHVYGGSNQLHHENCTAWITDFVVWINSNEIAREELMKLGYDWPVCQEKD